MNESSLVRMIANTALAAGKVIMQVYKGDDFQIEQKEDHSPLTRADKSAHLIISEGLETTPYPILSEEGKSIPFEMRKNWSRFWMVDPLDGTKEFIKKNGEFTVNIALIEDGEPILGVVYAPVKELLYIASKEHGSHKLRLKPEDVFNENLLNSASKLPQTNKNRAYTVVGSRSHASAETESFIQKIRSEKGELAFVSMGSSLKICLVAEGVADIYPRLAPTMEWDTAAGHAIARYAGCTVYQFENEKPVIYNKEDLLNPWFVVAGR